MIWWKRIGMVYYFQVAVLCFFNFCAPGITLAILLSSLMMFGNLAENYELVSMKSAGISLSRIMRPLIILSICISCLAFYFANIILPTANLKFLSLLYDIREKKLAFNIKEGVFYNGIEGFVIRVGKKDPDGNTIRDVMVYDHSKHQGEISLTVADWGKMELTPDKRFLVFRLYNGMNYEERTDLRQAERTRPFQRTKFKEQYQMFDLSTFQLTRTDEKLFKSNYEMLNVRQLQHSIDSIKRDNLLDRNNFEKNFIHNYSALSMLDTNSKLPANDSLKKLSPDVLGNLTLQEGKRYI